MRGSTHSAWREAYAHIMTYGAFIQSCFIFILYYFVGSFLSAVLPLYYDEV